MRPKLSFFVLLVCAATLAIACGTTTTPTEPTATAPPDPAPINDLRTRFQTAFNSGDAATIVNLYTDDAVMMPDHQPTVEGRAAIQQYYDQLFAQFTPNIMLTPGDTEITGDIAHEHGTFSITMTPKAGGNAMMDNGKYLVVLRRQADGSWRVHHDIDNSSNPHPGMAPPTTRR
jgi:uncharacterized protein (TIGR02246 family)